MVLLKDSLAGQVVMGAVICVASEDSRQGETLCSLWYYARMVRVKSAPIAATKSNTEEQEALLEESLLVVRAELRDLKAREQRRRFGNGTVSSKGKAFES